MKPSDVLLDRIGHFGLTREDAALAEEYGRFMVVFLERLAEQVARMKNFDVDPRYSYLVDFQRHLTQAAVEKPAITYRHRTLLDQFDVWRATGGLAGDGDPGDG